jgi:hypothetical protein
MNRFRVNIREAVGERSPLAIARCSQPVFQPNKGQIVQNAEKKRLHSFDMLFDINLRRFMY